MTPDVDQIRQTLGEAIFREGQSLADTGQVIETRTLQGGQVVTGVVEDNGRQRVYIQLATSEIDGECSCDLGENCSHVAAVLISIGQGATAKTGSESVPASVATKRAAAEKPAGQLQLAYRLTLASKQSCLAQTAVLQLSLWVGQPGGAWSPFQPQATRNGQYPRYVTQDDKAILSSLVGLQGDSDYLLQGDVGGQLLGACAATGRCFLGDVEQLPVALEDSVTAQPEWQYQTNGNQQLTLGLVTNHVCIANTQPAFALDPDSGQFKTLVFLEGQNSPLLLAKRQSLRPEDVPGFNQGLSTGVPAAKEICPVEVPLQALKGKLVLFSHDDRALARVQFLYNGNAFNSEELHSEQAVVRYMEGDTLREVRRDKHGEDQLKKQLKDFTPTGQALSLPGKRAWLAFMLLGRDALLRAGWDILESDDFPYRLAQARDWYGELMANPLAQGEDARQDWFSLELGIVVDGEPVNILPLLIQQLRHLSPGVGEIAASEGQQIDNQLMLLMSDGRYLPIPLERVEKILETLVELYDQDCLGEDQRLHLPASQASRLAQLQREAFGEEGDDLEWSGEDALQALAERLSQFDGIEPLTPPAEFQAELRSYQREGLGWLQFLREYQAGGILADDMGLGKTVQTLAHLSLEKSEGRLQAPCLIVAPTSLMGNWRNEAARFAPELKVLILHGPKRHGLFAQIPESDIILTTYPLLNFDRENLLPHEYGYLILDEAQTIKNPRAKASQVVRELVAEHRLCLTGTPMENHLGELWSLFDFLQPGLLGDERSFQQIYRAPIEQDANEERAQGLAKRIAPFILRRTKELVATELPAKTEIVRSIPLEEKQRDLYDSIRLTMHKQIREVIKEQGFARSHIAVLDALLKLRQACCDPRLLDLDTANGVTESAKFDTLMQMLPELVEEGRRILVFSQFTSMLALIESAVQALDIPCVKLTGQTRNRAEVVEQFQSGDIPVFLISLKAGGTGLNLTAADTVIHYDPWWNPAAENQATDRAYRIGQDKPVFVYKLVTEGTVEEKILQLQQRKQALAEGLYGNKAGSPTSLTQEDLEALLEPVIEGDPASQDEGSFLGDGPV